MSKGKRSKRGRRGGRNRRRGEKNKPAGTDKPVTEITSVEEFTRLYGEPTTEQTRRLAEQGAVNYLKYGQGGNEIGGVLGFVRIPKEDE